MWRGAHGPLAAIVVLAGGLLGCMPTPAPAPRRAASVEEEQEVEPYNSCGGVEVGDPVLTPAERRAAAVRAIEKAVTIWCAWDDKSVHRYGEIRLELRPGTGIEPSIASQRGAGLTEDDRRCVEEAARAVIQREEILAADFADDPTIYLALGAWPPLLPATEKLTARWLAAMRTKPARKRFAAQLPPEVRLEENDCLSIPVRPAFADSLERWLANVETPLPEYWQEPQDEGDWRRRGLLSHLGPLGGHHVRAYWLKDQAVLLHRTHTADRHRQELCLLALDETLRRKLRVAVDDRATCWVGDLEEIALHPRTAFPGDRRFKTVAVADTHVCALDEAGAAVCCGDRLHDDPPTEPLSAIAAGSEFDCGVTADGAMRCWGEDPPAGGDPIAGPFQEVAVDGRAACAIRRDTRALECWRADHARMEIVMRDRVADVVGWRNGLCARLEDGRISCGAPRAFPNGPFRALAVNGERICGVTVSPDPEVRCWGGWSEVSPPPVGTPPLPALADEPTGIALSGRDGCVLGRSGRVTCWPEARDRWRGLYRTIAGGGGGRFCAITADGRVQCDREWPYREGPQP